MSLFDNFKEWKSSFKDLTPKEESNLIQNILEFADTSVDDIAKKFISPSTAWDIVSNDDDMWETALSNSTPPKDLAYRAVVNDRENIHKLAYSLVYEQPELATQLFNELEYYRQGGRI